jgi:hypothetical protein
VGRGRGYVPARDITRITSTGLLLVLALWLLVGCASSPEDKSKEQSTPPVAGNFVGEAPDANAFVAVVSAGPDQEGAGEHPVRAYVSDGKSISEWFSGQATGNDLDLSSDPGAARLKGNLTPETSTGTITLADARSFTFTASPASGVAGLYNVTLADDGQVRGTSETGGRLEGTLGQQAENGSYPISGTITPPGGNPVDLQISAPSVEYGDYRWIVLSASRIKGAKKDIDTESSSGFIDSGS